MKIRDYTEKLSWEELKQIFQEFKQFERDSFIDDDCLLRYLAEKMTNENQVYAPSIVLWMNMVANDCYRLVAEKAIERGFTL